MMYKRLTLSPWATTMDCPSGLTLQKFYFERVPLEELLLIYLLCTRVLYFCLQGLALLFWIVILNNKRWTQKTYTQIKTPSEDRWFYFSAVATWPAIFLQPSYGSQQRGDHCSSIDSIKITRSNFCFQILKVLFALIQDPTVGWRNCSNNESRRRRYSALNGIVDHSPFIRKDNVKMHWNWH